MEGAPLMSDIILANLFVSSHVLIHWRPYLLLSLLREGEREQEAAKTHKIQIFRPEASFKSPLAAAAAVETLNYIVASFFPLQLNPTQKSHFGRSNVLFNGAQAEAGTADEGASERASSCWNISRFYLHGTQPEWNLSYASKPRWLVCPPIHPKIPEREETKLNRQMSFVAASHVH